MTLLPSPQRLWSQVGKKPTLIVISGEVGTGKTTYCTGIAQYVRAQGQRVGGLLSVGAFVAGAKVAIDLQDLTTGETRRLAIRRARPDLSSPTPNWQFDEAALRWGNAVLAATPACDLLIIDELGPLELLHGVGYQAAFPLIEREAYRLACVVVRRALVEVFTARFKVSEVFVLGER